MKTCTLENTSLPAEPDTEDEATELRTHYRGLSHFFATFEPRPGRHHAEPSELAEVSRESP